MSDDTTKLADACMCLQHDFGLLEADKRKSMMFEANEWLRALEKSGIIVRADTVEARIAEAVKAEREACAMEVDTLAAENDHWLDVDAADLMARASETIRMRTNT